MSGLVFLDLHVPSNETSGKASVLATTTDRFGKFFFVNANGDGLSLFVDLDRLDLSWLKGLRDKCLDVVTPADDVDFLVVELANNILHTCSTKSYTGTDWIDLFVSTVNSNFGAVSGLASEGTNFHRAISNLADLRFEKTTNEIGMTAGKYDLGSTRSVLYGYNVRANAITDVVVLSGNSFALAHDALELSKVDENVTTLETANRSTDDVAGTILELVVNHFLLRLPKTLHHSLLRSLSRDATEVGRSDVDLKFIFHINSRLETSGSEDVDFVIGTFDPVFYEKSGKGFDITLVWIDVNTEIASGANALFRGRQECRLESFHHRFAFDTFLLLVVFEKC